MKQILFSLLATALLSACSQDELSSPTGGVEGALPEGQYPLQISGIAFSPLAEPAGTDSAQTRVTDNGNSSVFENNDIIGVRISDSEETGEYRLIVDEKGNVTGVTPITPVYWQNTNPATITAWYPVDNEIDFTKQDQGLTYLLKGSGTASYDTPTSLTFEHQLAKVRVMLNGSRANTVSAVTVRSYPKSGNDQGTLGAVTGTATYVPMLPATYNGQTCWEATLRDGTLQANASFQLIPIGGGEPVQAVLDNAISIAPANVYNITITVNAKPLTITDGQGNPVSGYDLGSGTYIISGTGNKAITINGNADITLDNASISVESGNAISITGGNPTIHVHGENTIENNSIINGAGIYVAAGSSVTITGRDRSDILTAIAGGDAAGIGGCYNNQDCGSINISNVTVIARGSQYLTVSPGIGSTSTNQCGQITIDDATVHAYGEGISNVAECPAIGTGIANSLDYGTTLPTVIIRNKSEIHVHRGGSSADYIGYPFVMGSSTGAASAINLGAGGSITGSTVYCYTGTSTITDKVVEY